MFFSFSTYLLFTIPFRELFPFGPGIQVDEKSKQEGRRKAFKPEGRLGCVPRENKSINRREGVALNCKWKWFE